MAPERQALNISKLLLFASPALRARQSSFFLSNSKIASSDEYTRLAKESIFTYISFRFSPTPLSPALLPDPDGDTTMFPVQSVRRPNGYDEPRAGAV